jgi:hypothetical protein
MEHNRVAIPGIGTLHLQAQQAYFNSDHTTLYPPKTKVYYSPSYDHEFGLASLLYEGGMSKQDADQIENYVIDDYKTARLQNLPFELNGFGSFVNEEFIEKDPMYFNKFEGLNQVPTVAIQSGSKKIREDMDFDDEPDTQKAERSNLFFFLWPALLAVLTSILILLWFMSEKEVKQPIESGKMVMVEPTLQTNSDTMYQKIDSSLSSQASDDTIGNDEDVTEMTTPNETSNSNELKLKPESAGDCIVIVGSFSKPSNAKRLERRIRSKGFEPFIQEHSGMIRVGIRYHCDNQNQDAFKRKMQKIFNPEAWHLHDTI